MWRNASRTGGRWLALVIAAMLGAAAILPATLEAQAPAAQPPAAKKPAGGAPPAPAQTPKQRELAVAKVAGKWTGDLDGMIQRRYIRVATTYNKTHYFIDKGVQRGTVYEAMKLFEDELNEKLKTQNIRVHAVFVP